MSEIPRPLSAVAAVGKSGGTSSPLFSSAPALCAVLPVAERTDRAPLRNLEAALAALAAGERLVRGPARRPRRIPRLVQLRPPSSALGRTDTGDGVERNEAREPAMRSAALRVGLERKVDGVSLPHVIRATGTLEQAHRAVSTGDDYAELDFRSMRAGREVRTALISRDWSAKRVWVREEV